MQLASITVLRLLEVGHVIKYKVYNNVRRRKAYFETLRTEYNYFIPAALILLSSFFIYLFISCNFSSDVLLWELQSLWQLKSAICSRRRKLYIGNGLFSIIRVYPECSIFPILPRRAAGRSKFTQTSNDVCGTSFRSRTCLGGDNKTRFHLNPHKSLLT